MDIIEVDSPLAGADTDDLAMQLKRTIQEIQELRDYEKVIRRELANRTLDQPQKLLHTSYGSYRGRWVQPYKAWQRDSITQVVYDLARKGELHEPDSQGELPGSAEWRILDALKRVFRFEPRVGQVKAIGLDPDEFASPSGDGHWDVSIVGEDKL